MSGAGSGGHGDPPLQSSSVFFTAPHGHGSVQNQFKKKRALWLQSVMTSAARLDRSEKAGMNGRSSRDRLGQELPFAGEGRLHIFGEQHRNCLARKRSLLVRRSVRTGRFRYQASTRRSEFRGCPRGKLLKERRIKFWEICDSATHAPEFGSGFGPELHPRNWPHRSRRKQARLRALVSIRLGVLRLVGLPPK